MSYTYQKAVKVHQVTEYLGCAFDKAWQVVTCLEKEWYRTEEEAAAHGAKWGYRPYECPVCGRWHLTKNREREEGE